ENDDMRGVEAAERAVGAARPEQPAARDQPVARDQPAAIVNGQPVSWDELRPVLDEAAGGQALQEAALDRLLPQELKSRGLSITEQDVAAERRLLLESIVRDAKASPDDAERLMETVRRTRGLGELRFRRLLERNAQMRKIVAPTVAITEAEVGQAF